MKTRTLLIFLIASLLQPYTACGMNSDAPAHRGYRILDEELARYFKQFCAEGDWQWHKDDRQGIIQSYLDLAIGNTMNPQFVAKIIEKGANIQTPRQITAEWIMSPLAHAVRVMHADKNLDHYLANIELLLERGAHFCDADEKDPFLLQNCLYQLKQRLNDRKNWEFEERRSTKCIQQLIERGPFLLAPSKHYEPLCTALEMPCVVKYLLERGLISREGKCGRNALQEARVEAQREIEEKSGVTRYRESLALIEDNIRRQKLAQEILPLAKQNNSHLKKLPAELVVEISKYIAY